MEVFVSGQLLSRFLFLFLSEGQKTTVDRILAQFDGAQREEGRKLEHSVHTHGAAHARTCNLESLPACTSLEFSSCLLVSMASEDPREKIGPVVLAKIEQLF